MAKLTLNKLFAEYRSAYKAFIASFDFEEKASTAYFKTHPKEIVIRLSIGGGVSFDACQNDLDVALVSARTAIIHIYGERRNKLVDGLHRIASAKVQTGILAEWQAAKEKDILKLERIARKEQRERNATTFGAALKAVTDTAKAEVDAIRAICEYRCASPEEERQRAAFILDHIPNYKDLIHIDLITFLLHTLADRKAVRS